MKKVLVTTGALALVSLSLQAQVATVFQPGQLAVLQLGDGLTNRCAPLGAVTGITNYSASDIFGSRQTQLFIDQFNPNGVMQTNPVQQVAIPTNGPTAMLINGNAGTEGNMTLSDDRSVLTFAGYQGDILSITTGGQTAPSNLSYDRGIGTVDAFGNYSNPYRGGGWYGISTGKTNPRGVATDGQGNFWGCGNGYGSLYFNAINAPEPIQFQNIALTSCSKVINHVLYASVKASESVNLYPAGLYTFVDFYNNPVNLPTTASFLHLYLAATAPYTTVIGYDISPDQNTAYLADTTYGVQKYVRSGLAWKLAYNLAIPGYIDSTSKSNLLANNFTAATNFVGAFSVSVDWTGTNPVIYATTSDAGNDAKDTYYGNRVIRINDTNTIQNGVSLTNYSIISTVVFPKRDANGLICTNIVYKSVTFTPDLRPAITGNPANWSAAAGDTVNFNVSATANYALTYQWLQNGTNLSGQTAATLTLNSVTTGQSGYAYQCVVSDFYGSVTSAVATLTVNGAPVAPVITLFNVTNYVGNNVTFTANVSGTDAKGGFQWYFNGAALTDGNQASGSSLTGSTSNVLAIVQAQTADAGVYSLVVTNIAGSTSNAAVNLVLTYSAPVIVQAPVSQYALAGTSVTNFTKAFGSLTTNLWYSGYTTTYSNYYTLTTIVTNGVVQKYTTNNALAKVLSTGLINPITDDGVNYSGAATPNLTILNVSLASNPANVLASTLSGWVTNSTSVLTTNSAKTIVTNTTTLVISSAFVTNSLNNYAVVYTNPGGAVTSTPPATLTVIARPPHSFVSYTGQSYLQTFDTLPTPCGSSIEGANPVSYTYAITNFTALAGNPSKPYILNNGNPDATFVGTLNYSVDNPFDFAYPAVPSGNAGGYNLPAMAGWYGWAQNTMIISATRGDQSQGAIANNGLNYLGDGTPLATVTNRALGLVATTKTGADAIAVALVNNSTNTYNYINLGLLGELWRNNPNQQVLLFSYAIDPAGSNSVFNPTVDSGSLSAVNGNSLISVTNLNVIFPTTPTTTINVGTDPTNQVSLAVTNLAISAWAPGTTLWLVWQANTLGSAQDVAIDNVAFSAVRALPVLPINITSGSGHFSGAAGAGSYQFAFTNAAGVNFSVWGSTNAALPLSQWKKVGAPVETSAGNYQFTDATATNRTMFYIISQP